VRLLIKVPTTELLLTGIETKLAQILCEEMSMALGQYTFEKMEQRWGRNWSAIVPHLTIRSEAQFSREVGE